MGLSSRRSTTNAAREPKVPEHTLMSSLLQTSLVDAQLLMMTAAERGIELDEEVTRTILETSNAFDKNQLTPAIASGFWHAYEVLSHTLSPITIDSVRATHDMRGLRAGVWGSLQGRNYVPFSRKSAFSYKVLSLLTLLTLIALQVFWAIGNTLVVDIKDQSDRIIELEEQLFNDHGSIRSGSESTLSQRQRLQANSGSEKENETPSNIPDSQEGSSRPTDVQVLNRQIGEYISWRNAEIIELKNWNRFWGRIIFFSEQTWEKPDYSQLSPESKLHVHYVSAQYVLHAISAYFLPILYGLLGASFYVLRQLPKDIESLTFSMNSHIDYSLRITQGPLAGIMASFFFTEAPNKLYSLTSHSSAIATVKLGSSSLADFSPLAIAFLAGYSVELIFYVIDKIISTVTTRSTTTLAKSSPLPEKKTSPGKATPPSPS